MARTLAARTPQAAPGSSLAADVACLSHEALLLVLEQAPADARLLARGVCRAWRDAIHSAAAADLFASFSFDGVPPARRTVSLVAAFSVAARRCAAAPGAGAASGIRTLDATGLTFRLAHLRELVAVVAEHGATLTSTVFWDCMRVAPADGDAADGETPPARHPLSARLLVALAAAAPRATLHCDAVLWRPHALAALRNPRVRLRDAKLLGFEADAEDEEITEYDELAPVLSNDDDGMDLDDLFPNDGEGEDIALLAAQPELRGVVIDEARVTHAQLLLFAAAAALERFALQDCRMDDGAVAGLAAIVAGCPRLTALELRQYDWYEFGDEDKEDLFDGASEDAVDALVAAVAGSRLEQLALASVCAFDAIGGLFEDTPGARMLNALRGHPTLQVLDVSGNALDEHKEMLASALLRLLRDPGCRLRVLRTQNNELTEGMTRRLLRAAAACCSLNELDVSGNGDEANARDADRLRAARPDMTVTSSDTA